MAFFGGNVLLREGGVYGVLSIPSANTPVEVKVGASKLAQRQCLIITSGANDIYWGLDSSVTTSTGQRMFINQTQILAIDPDSEFQVWVVSANASVSCRIMEIP